MSLQFILGNSGSGKTEYAFAQIVAEAGQHPLKNYLIIVPEQFTMQTQKKLVELAPNKAIMNIDVLSFKRLAYRVFDDMGFRDLNVLEETGKNLVLRKVAQEKADSLTVLRPNMSRMGYIQELKSLISELVQYNISPENLEKFADGQQLPPSFSLKLKDIVTMYRGFQDYMKGHYVTAEEILGVLIGMVEESALLRDSVIVFDEFTGFTPIQNRLLLRLLPVAERIEVLLTIDKGEALEPCKGEHELFYMTKKTILSLTQMAKEVHVDVLKPVLLDDSENKRFAQAKALSFMEQNLFRPWYQKKRGPVEEIRISSLRNPKEELLAVAREINVLVRQKGYRYREIAVVSGAVDTYANYVEEIFEQYQIPYFLDQTTEALFHPFIELIRAALEVVESNFSYEAMLRFLRCGFCDIPEEQIDRLENYLLAVGIRGKKQWEKKWLRMPKDSAGYDLSQLNLLREKLYGVFEPLYDAFFGKEKRVCDQIRCLYELLLQLNVEKQLWEKESAYLLRGMQSKAKEYGQIYQVVMELLEKFFQLLGEEPLDISSFIEILDAGLSAAQVASIPPGFDSVTIGDIERTRLAYVKVLFFVGVNDGIIPKTGASGGIISEYEREMMQNANLELAPGAREQAFIQRFYLYRNLTKPSERLYISYARVDNEGKAVRASYLIRVLCNLFPDLPVTEYDDLKREPDLSTEKAAMDYLIYGEHGEQWFVLAKYFEEKGLADAVLSAPYTRYLAEPISKAVARAVYGRTMEGSVTRLERYAACAYAHFLQYGLRLREREEFRFANVDMGNIYHAALERYSHKVENSEFDWFRIPDEMRNEYASEAFAEALESYRNLSVFSTEASMHMVERMHTIFAQTVWALTKQVRMGQCKPSHFELSFLEMEQLESLKISLNDGMRMKLLGRIDRIDTCVDDGDVYVKIIDYKSGNTKFDLIQIYQGLSLQLVVYMNAAMEYTGQKHPKHRILPGGILYYKIDDPVLPQATGEQVTETQLEEQLLKALRPDGLVNAEENIYRSMDEFFETESLAIPVKRKKNGELSATSHVASSEDFAVIGEYVKQKIKEQGEEIYQGNIAVNPYKDKQECSCDYCGYSAVCGMDLRIPGYKYRTLEQVSKDEVISRMQEAIHEHNVDK